MRAAMLIAAVVVGACAHGATVGAIDTSERTPDMSPPEVIGSPTPVRSPSKEPLLPPADLPTAEPPDAVKPHVQPQA